MPNPPVHWLCDTRLTEARPNTGFPSVAEAARELGYPVAVIDYDSRSGRLDAPDWSEDACVVTYGTMQFTAQITRRYPCWQPGMLGRRDQVGYLATAGHLGALMLNDDFVLLPYGEVLRRGCDAFGDAFFLKPEDVGKAFAGFVMTRAKWDIEVETLRQKSALSPDTLCVVASPKAIEAEFRFVIADRKVVTGSQYRWDDRLDVRLDVTPNCLEIAERVASHPWQPDCVYVCDVALLDGRTEARVVELNSFSSAGLYACDTRAIVDAVSRAAWNEHQGLGIP